MRVKLLGRYYNLRFLPHLGDNDGFCDPPDKKGKEIRIQSGLRGRALSETIIHEALHGADWHVREDLVTQMANDIARLLHRPEVWSRITEAPE